MAAVGVARECGAPVLSRGGGTSLAGQCTNTAVVLDWSKYCTTLESVDAEAKRCVVQPGIVLDELNRQLEPTGLRYGPEPSTHPNCTLGGMIGNNSCGSTAQRCGKVVDNIARLEVLCYENPDALKELLQGPAFLMVQFGGHDQHEVDAQAKRMLDGLHESEHDPTVAYLDDPAREDELWHVRESGLGATAHVPGHAETFEGWEDSAVPPDRLGGYLRRLQELYAEFGYSSDAGPSLYGHFGQGCVHTRIPFDLFTAHGVAAYRRFLQRAADLVSEFGGSLSDEHGDGQTRGELLSRMFGKRLMSAFAELKDIFDPQNKMNPGKVVAPHPPDADLRLGGDWAPAAPQDLHFGYPHDGGSFVHAANRCVGVGKCRQLDTSAGQVMCPSYQVTREEQHCTRGRARLLFEMLDGHGDSPIHDGWRSTAVKEALDLCLACKGCKSDCPADVDMATYKAEFLAHHYQGRQWRRPRSDLSMGWLPIAAHAVTGARMGWLANALTHTPGLRKAVIAAAGVADRDIPRFANQTLRQWFDKRTADAGGSRGTVMLWPDTFTNCFHPHVGRAAVSVIEEAGWRVILPPPRLCCGLTWISTGQLNTGKKVLARSVAALAAHVRAGGLVVGLEPSCAAVFRSDAAELFPDDRDVLRLRDQTVTLAELLTQRSPGYEPPRAAEWKPDRTGPGPLPSTRRAGLGRRCAAVRQSRGRC